MESASNIAECSQMTRGRGKNKRNWSAEEDKILIETLQEVSTDPTYKNKKRWKEGYLLRVEELMMQKLPNSGLKANPHIDSRWKLMKRKHHAILEMLSKPGFGWDDTKKMIQCEKSVYDEWCKNHNDAKGLWNMPFPYYEIIELVGGDRATEKDSETVSEAVNNMDKEVENETTNSMMEENREDSDDDDDDVYATEKAYEPTSRSAKKTKKNQEKSFYGRKGNH